MNMRFLSNSNKNLDKIMDLVSSDGIGGIHFWYGDVGTALTLLNKIQLVNSLNYSIRDLMNKSSASFRKSLVHLHSEGEIASSPYHANGKIQKAKKYSSMLSVDA